MTKSTAWWRGGLAVVVLGSVLALAACTDMMGGSGAAMKPAGTMMKGDSPMRTDMDKGMMDNGMTDKSMMDKK